MGQLMVRVGLPAAVAGRLVVTRPASRLPVLLGLLALTAGLAVVAARQLRREQDLVRLRAGFHLRVSLTSFAPRSRRSCSLPRRSSWAVPGTRMLAGRRSTSSCRKLGASLIWSKTCCTSRGPSGR